MADKDQEVGIPGDEARPDGQMAPGLMANRIGFRLRILQSMLGARVVEGFAPYKMRPGTFTTMALMAANPGCSQVDLAREGGLDKSALVAIVDDLEARGLAIRGRSAKDRRRNSLFLTQEGEKLMNEMYLVAHDTERTIREAFSPEELKQLFALLERAYQVLSSEEQPAT